MKITINKYDNKTKKFVYGTEKKEIKDTVDNSQNFTIFLDLKTKIRVNVSIWPAGDIFIVKMTNLNNESEILISKNPSVDLREMNEKLEEIFKNNKDDGLK